jgi:hypothetical protein
MVVLGTVMQIVTAIGEEFNGRFHVKPPYIYPFKNFKKQ